MSPSTAAEASRTLIGRDGLHLQHQRRQLHRRLLYQTEPQRRHTDQQVVETDSISDSESFSSEREAKGEEMEEASTIAVIVRCSRYSWEDDNGQLRKSETRRDIAGLSVSGDRNSHRQVSCRGSKDRVNRRCSVEWLRRYAMNSTVL